MKLTRAQAVLVTVASTAGATVWMSARKVLRGSWPAAALAVVIGLAVPGPAMTPAAQAASAAPARAASAGRHVTGAIPVTAYVGNNGSDTVTPIQTATNTALKAI